MRLLVVDPDPRAAAAASAALEACGHQPLHADGAREAHALLALADADGVILGASLPGDRSRELLQVLRADSRTRSLPVLLLSATDDAAERVRGQLTGANEVLAASAGPEQAALRIEELVARRTASSGGLFTELADGALIELLGVLEEEGATGIARLICRPRDGWVELDRGRLVATRYGLLQGWEAMLAMLDLTGVSFAFEPRRASDSVLEPLIEGGSPLTTLSLRHAQLRDRLERFERFLPDLVDGLRATRGHLSADLGADQDIPYAEVYARIRALPGVTTAELLEHQLAPDVHVLLALSVLAKTSAIETVAANAAELPYTKG